jgi:hypothetical protein
LVKAGKAAATCAEIDAIVLDDGSDEEDELPSIDEDIPPVSRLDDQWTLGDHRVLCADACDPKSFQRLLGRERAQMVFTDPPYNVLYVPKTSSR